MACIFKSEMHSVAEMRNAVFARKATVAAIKALAGAATPFVLYGFQDNAIGSPGVDNEYGQAAYDMGLLNPLAWTPNAGWYQIPAGLGQGLRNDGGVSGYVGAIPNGINVNMTGKSFTILAKVRLTTLGEGAGGTLIWKLAGYNIQFVTVDEIQVGLWAGGAWNNIVTNDSPLAGGWGYWHDLAIVYNGANIAIYWDGFLRGVAGAVPAAIADGANPVNVMDNDTNTRAMEGNLGLLAIIPNVVLTQAQIQALIELGPLAQVTAANQPQITRFVRNEYSFDFANLRHFRSYQVAPVMGQTGTVLAWIRPEDFANEQVIVGVFQDGANGDGLSLEVRGDIALDPIEIMGRAGGVVNLRLQHAFGAVQYGGRHLLAVTSDGLLTRMYWNGALQTVAVPVGANTGQWTASYPASTQLVIGAARQIAVASGLGAKLPQLVMYDREFMPGEIDALWRYGWWRALPND